MSRIMVRRTVNAPIDSVFQTVADRRTSVRFGHPGEEQCFELGKTGFLEVRRLSQLGYGDRIITALRLPKDSTRLPEGHTAAGQSRPNAQ